MTANDTAITRLTFSTGFTPLTDGSLNIDSAGEWPQLSEDDPAMMDYSKLGDMINVPEYIDWVRRHRARDQI